MTTTHKTADCWYLYPEKRPMNWMPRKLGQNLAKSGTNINKKYPKSEYSLEAQKKQKAMIATILDTDTNTSGQSS
jgi:hypothetical protein